MKKKDANLVSGLAWYRREQWQLLRESAADPESLEDTYEEWLKLAQKTVLDLASSGVRAERIDVDVEEIVAWCRSRHRRLDGEARAEFATHKLREKYDEKG